eukprot:343428_1
MATDSEEKEDFVLICLQSVICQKSKERDKGIKLLIHIFNNIISNPSKPKYRNINVNAIATKLTDSEIWINLLITAGFEKIQSPNESQLLFNANKLPELKFAKDILSQYQSNTSTKSVPPAKLFKGLTKFTSNGFYSCDQCNANPQAEAKMFGCRKCDFDLCNSCVQNSSMHRCDEYDNKNDNDCNDIKTETEWRCTICAFHNPSSENYCKICETPRVDSTNTKWQCSTCTFINSDISSICELCGGAKFSSGSNNSNSKLSEKLNKIFDFGKHINDIFGGDKNDNFDSDKNDNDDFGDKNDDFKYSNDFDSNDFDSNKNDNDDFVDDEIHSFQPTSSKKIKNKKKEKETKKKNKKKGFQFSGLKFIPKGVAAISQSFQKGLQQIQKKAVSQMQSFQKKKKKKKGCNIHVCSHFKKFVLQMQQFQMIQKNDIENIMELETHVIDTLNYYHHLIEKHNNDDFEFIVNSLQHCDLNKCDKFRRNFRDKNEPKYNDEQKTNLCLNDNVYLQIIDKIHTYFCHSFDIGYRLKAVDKKIFTDNNKNMNQKNNDVVPKGIKKTKFSEMNLLVSDTSNSIVAKYSYGYRFIYENHDKCDTFEENDKLIYVYPKYKSFKEEVTNNEISILTMQQFNNESAKAFIHWNGYFRRSHYPKMEAVHVLCLMVYCNFDGLQSRFSRTYREKLGEEHKEFYHLGKGLKQTVLKHGMGVRHVKISKFYHGVNQQLVPVEIVGDLGKGVNIYCPLSTSTSMSVAINFTEQNKGL